jgi:MoCo/4Fe-4S cofactor protein with predicted Tat translocation signal
MSSVKPTDALAGGEGCESPEHEAPMAVRQGRAYWRSLEDRADSPEFREFMEREFPEGADRLEGDDRRQFLRVMGASFALAGVGLAGCRRRPELTIVPYAARPADRTPGIPVHYATAMELGGVASGLLVKSYDGRPIKIEGNPDHPFTLGACDPISQASVLELYDPERSRLAMRNGEAAGSDAFSKFESFMTDRLAGHEADGGAGLAVMSEAFSGPTMTAARKRFMARFPKATWCEWEAIDDDHERAGLATAFGRPVRPERDFSQAKVVVTLDADVLRNTPTAIRDARGFASTRRVDAADPASQELGRLYAFEPTLTLTGVNADERVPVRGTDIAAIAAMLAERVGAAPDGPLGAALTSLAGSPAASRLSAQDLEILDAAARDLKDHPGEGLVVVGPNQPAAVHALVAMLNERLGNAGRTIAYREASDADRPTRSAAIRDLCGKLSSGSISTLAILGGNPVYDAPADLDFAACMAKAEEVVHLSFHRNETSADAACSWHLPRAHFLESWNDARAWDGTVSLVQPLIEPLVSMQQGGRSALEMVAMMAGEAPFDGYQLVRRAMMERTGTSGKAFERLWRKSLNDGVEKGTQLPIATVSADAAAIGSAMSALPMPVGEPGLELAFTRDGTVYDGRFANIGWLQELPEPVTKFTWDNALLVSVPTAKSMGLSTGDMVSVTVDAGGSARSVDAAVAVQPGQAEGVLALSLGYGRGAVAGTIAADAGFDAYRVRTLAASHIVPGVRATRTDGRYAFARTQDHGAVDALVESVPEAGIQERLPTLVREGTLGEYRDHPDFARHRTHVASRLSLWEETNLDGAKFAWAMSIDLSTCIGCGACVTACQAENNVPVVGKDQIARGREMHWIRIDRYYRGENAARPDAVLMQPVACQHCENAPCEQVCPVAATVHDEEGLNVMVYNRCIGTRYCSNNCPYKVRRFNYFDYQRRDPIREQEGPFAVKPDYYLKDGPNEWRRMQFNPEVTVRTRGVMEKCTFCTQRISEAKIRFKNEWAQRGGVASGEATWSIPDGAIVPACAQACPTEAIVFGDLNQTESRVAKLHRSKLSYEMLEELNNRPRLRYLAKVSNPAIERDHGHGHGHGHGHDHGDGHDHGHDDGGHAAVLREETSA